VSPWRSWASAAQLFVLVLVGQPLLQRARGLLAARFFPGQGDVEGMARALAESEARSEHAGRLAEIGTLAAAVAHEVRNPLGVMRASVRILERQGADAAQLGEMRSQLDRAAQFADELLEYGRPAPLTRRPIDVLAIAEMVASELSRSLPLDPFPTVTVSGAAGRPQADLSQVVRMVGVLVENAALATGPGGAIGVTVSEALGVVSVCVDDDGPGVPDALRDTLFQPFVSGRGRDGPRPGTGLGLAIARGVAVRHGGDLSLAPQPSPLGGARFLVSLPLVPPLPAAGQ
jgi:signal transduction histidine kinase